MREAFSCCQKRSGNRVPGSLSAALPLRWNCQHRSAPKLALLTSYKKFREKLLNSDTWRLIARLGPQAFQTPMWDFNVQLLLISRGQVNEDEDVFAEDGFANQLCGLDVSEFRSAQEKGEKLIDTELKVVSQARQLKNPDAVIMFDNLSSQALLKDNAFTIEGLSTGDSDRFIRFIWETDNTDNRWCLFIQNVTNNVLYGGRSEIVNYIDVRQYEKAHNFPGIQ